MLFPDLESPLPTLIRVEILSRLFSDGVMENLGIKKTRTNPLHPQSDGMVERFNRTILDYLAKFVDSDQRNWDQLLLLALMAYRSAEHEATGFSPALMNLDREPRLPSDIVFGPPPSIYVSSDSKYLAELLHNMKEIDECARANMKFSADRMKARYDLRAEEEEPQTTVRLERTLFDPQTFESCNL